MAGFRLEAEAGRIARAQVLEKERQVNIARNKALLQPLIDGYNAEKERWRQEDAEIKQRAAEKKKNSAGQKRKTVEGAAPAPPRKSRRLANGGSSSTAGQDENMPPTPPVVDPPTILPVGATSTNESAFQPAGSIPANEPVTPPVVITPANPPPSAKPPTPPAVPGGAAPVDDPLTPPPPTPPAVAEGASMPLKQPMLAAGTANVSAKAPTLPVVAESASPPLTPPVLAAGAADASAKPPMPPAVAEGASPPLTLPVLAAGAADASAKEFTPAVAEGAAPSSNESLISTAAAIAKKKKGGRAAIPTWADLRGAVAAPPFDFGPEALAWLQESMRVLSHVENKFGFDENPQTGVGGEDRPAEVFRWIKSGRGIRQKGPYDAGITNLRDEVEITSGKAGGGHSVDCDWDLFWFPGQNGCISIVASLYFWGSSRSALGGEGGWEDENREEWERAVADVVWILEGLEQAIPTPKKKRVRT
ncbi:hypothetical protein B0H13DRAFT_2368683 [Mycena leptocephala]|nr:hypothetical protein B0H13DRAFT_2368683 [Mycena leptocephala]